MSTLAFPKTAQPVPVLAKPQAPEAFSLQNASRLQGAAKSQPNAPGDTVQMSAAKERHQDKISTLPPQPPPEPPAHDSLFRAESLQHTPINPAHRPSRLDLLQSAQKYWQHGANRDIVKALTWNYAPGILLSASMLLPMGPVIAAIGIVPAWQASKRGEKMVDHLLASGRLDQTQGPLARLTKLNGLWGLSERPPEESRNVPRRMMHEFNHMVHELFPAKGDPDAVALRDWLTIKPGTKAFRMLNHAFNAKTFYAHTMIGKVSRPLRRWAHKIPFAPVKLLLRLPQLLTMLPVILFNWSAIRNMARHI